QIPITFKYRSDPAVASGFAVFAPDRTTATSSAGQFSVVLPMGAWDMIVGGAATYELVVPDDDATYNFTDILSPESEVSQSVDIPLAVLGLHIKQIVAELRAVPSNTVNRLGVDYSPDVPDYVFYRWDAD